jgi:4-amino-4-deoxy-L-arabinose transferase-like glycosyltransferase
MKALLELVRQNKRFFFFATLAALALRLTFVFVFPYVAGDTFVYGDIAKQWLNHGVYGLLDARGLHPTLMRLPGYPAFLAAIFSVFGQEHYTAVMLAQSFVDTNTCLVIAGLALELMNVRAAKVAYVLAALCPFTANYVATPLTETLAIACAAHALYYGVRGIRSLQAGEAGLHLWALAGLWTGLGMLVRPDGAILLAALGCVLLAMLVFLQKKMMVVAAGVVVLVCSLAPLAPWTIRNWRTFHVFEPLAPRYANDPGEFVAQGFNRWTKTWIVDYVSVAEVYWRAESEPLDVDLLPQRAFDSREQYEKTEDLFDQHNQQLYIDPDMDAEFHKLAADRINHNPFRYFVWLPALRIADMWLRPRTELLEIGPRWWEFSNDRKESSLAMAWGALNLLLLMAAFRGWLHAKMGTAGALLVVFVLLRSAFLGTLENPEPRYVLECFPALLALAGGAFAALGQLPRRNTE